MGNKKAIVQVIGINVENEERIDTLLKGIKEQGYSVINESALFTFSWDGNPEESFACRQEPEKYKDFLEGYKKFIREKVVEKSKDQTNIIFYTQVDSYKDLLQDISKELNYELITLSRDNDWNIRLA